GSVRPISASLASIFMCSSATTMMALSDEPLGVSRHLHGSLPAAARRPAAARLLAAPKIAGGMWAVRRRIRNSRSGKIVCQGQRTGGRTMMRYSNADLEFVAGVAAGEDTRA